MTAAEDISHIPPELVRDFRFETLPGVEVDSVQAAIDAVRGGPEIFYGLGVRAGRGAWVVTTHELIREVFQDTDLFSSQRNADYASLVGEDWLLLPLEADPPSHAGWRMLLNPIFSPGRMKLMEAQIEGLAVDLIDDLVAKGECEFVSAFGQTFPVRIFLQMFGLPLEHTERLMAWHDDLVHSSSLEGLQRGARAIVDYLREVLAERRAQPRDDLLSYVATATIDGRALAADEALGVAMLLYVAGLDTVANALGFIFKHLAEHPDDQQLLRDDPALIPNAIEELLRAYPIVLSWRVITRDTEWRGIKMKKGERVVLPTMLAGRDESEFPNPDAIDFRRERLAHISFAAGPHRCVGSHLARRELRVALEQWLTRVPPFRIKEGERVITHGVAVFGLTQLPLAWDVP